MVKSYDKLSLIVKLILQIFLGWIISPAYRIIKGIGNNDGMQILFGIIAILPIFWWIDVFSILFTNKIFVLA